MDWELLHTFEITLRTGSFAAAAREMGIEHTTVRRRVSSLEEALGQRLFERSTQGLLVTQAGEAIAAEVGRMAAAAEAASRAAEQVGSELAGPVRVTTPPILRSLVISGLGPLLRKHPRVTLDLVEGVEYADLTRREADLALRIRPPGVPAANDDTPARRLGALTFGVYAPEGWQDRPLHEAPVVRYNDHAPSDLTSAVLLSLPSPAPLGGHASGMLGTYELVRQGLGWTVLADLGPSAWPGVVRLADAPQHFVAWLAIQGSRRTHPAVRLVADALVQTWKELVPQPT